jgi:LacI family gluconate utilization system Gnt-I transcriptional repressor
LLHRPAGILVTGFDRSDATRALLAGSGVPCVHLMETASTEGVHSVGFSQHQASSAMTRHLLERGRRRIAFAAAQLDPRTLQRMEGWRDTLREHGLYTPTLEWLNPAPSSIGLGGVLFEQIMGQSPPVDAIFFCNDDLAQGALLTALRMGIRVPERVAVAGFNDLTGSDQMLPPLTTIRTPRAEMGAAAAEMLLKLMRGTPVPSRRVDVGFELVVRGST